MRKFLSTAIAMCFYIAALAVKKKDVVIPESENITWNVDPKFTPYIFLLAGLVFLLMFVLIIRLAWEKYKQNTL
nr:hypothetical protein [uncultured Draconibacterium sp.]